MNLHLSEIKGSQNEKQNFLALCGSFGLTSNTFVLSIQPVKGKESNMAMIDRADKAPSIDKRCLVLRGMMSTTPSWQQPLNMTI